MSAGDLPRFTPPAEPPEEKNKKKEIKIRCLLLFDGTLNNKGNIDERLKHEKGQSSAIYLKNRQNQGKEQRLKKGDEGIDLEDDSYENDYSNIVTLEANIATMQSAVDDTVIIYTEGAGTLKYTDPNDGTIGDNKDRLGGYAFSAGESGIKAKVENGINDAVARIGKGSDGERNPEEFIIKKLTIDVFGFSRGAASARYCVHRLLKAEDAEAYIKRRLRALMFEVEEVEVCFVGLFDTVTSYYGAQIVKLVPLENWFVKLKSFGQVKKVVQLASAEEHRYHFSLHNINSAGPKGEQYFLPGVHSDIGGSYLDKASDANLIVFQGPPHEVAKDRDHYLVAKGWFKPEQLVEEVTRYQDTEGSEPLPAQVQLRITKENENYNNVKTRVVHNAYCRIPLKLMAEAAGKSGITFESELEERATEIIDAFPELTKLESRIKAHIAQVGPRGSRPEHWQVIEPELNAIRHKHLHFSARYNTVFGHNPRRSFFSRERKRYEFDG